MIQFLWNRSLLALVLSVWASNATIKTWAAGTEAGFLARVEKTSELVQQKAALNQCTFKPEPGALKHSKDQRSILPEVQALVGREIQKITENNLWDSNIIMSKEEGLTSATLKRLQLGQVAPDFKLEELGGQRQVQISDYHGKQPVLLIFGSYTCWAFRRQLNAIEALAQKYQEKIKVFIVYTLEAHPYKDKSPYVQGEWHGVVNDSHGILIRQHRSLAERKEVATQCRTNLNIQLPLLVDTMGNSTWQIYGGMPNSAFLIGVDGNVLLKQPWFNAGLLESKIQEILK